MSVSEDVEVVEFEDLSLFPAIRLLAAQAGDPCVQPGQFFLKRDYFSDRAAKVGRPKPQLRAMLRGLGFGRLLGKDGLDLDFEEFLQPPL